MHIQIDLSRVVENHANLVHAAAGREHAYTRRERVDEQLEASRAEGGVRLGSALDRTLLTVRIASKSSPNPSTSFSMYTLRNADRLSSSFSAAGRNEGISRGGGEEESVGRRARSFFAGAALATVLGFASESESESESESLESESLESEESLDDEAEDDEAAEDAPPASTSIFASSSSSPLSLSSLSSLLESVAYDAALRLRFRGRRVAWAACSAAMVWFE